MRFGVVTQAKFRVIASVEITTKNKQPQRQNAGILRFAQNDRLFLARQ